MSKKMIITNHAQSHEKFLKILMEMRIQITSKETQLDIASQQMQE